MKAPHMLVLVLTIALAAIFLPAHADAAPVTQPSLAKAVAALEAATGGKVLEIRFVDEVGHERSYLISAARALWAIRWRKTASNDGSSRMPS